MPQHIALKDPHRESRIYSARTVTAILVVLGLLGVILSRYHSLQVIDYEQGRLTFNPGECAGHMPGMNSIGVLDLADLSTDILKF